MFTVRWITGEYDRTHCRDEAFPTKASALKAISAVRVNTIRRFNRLYCVQVKKAGK